MAQSSNSASTGVTVGDILGVVVDGQTYRNLLYLVLAFPLGMAYFVVLTVGFSLGVGLAVFLVGIGILLATVIGLRWVADIERRLSNALLETSIAAPDDVADHDGGIAAVARAYLSAPSTWRGFGFVMLKFWAGTLSFVLLVTTLGVAIELLLLPVIPGGALNVQINDVVIAETLTTSAERALAVPAGAALYVIALHLVNAVAGVNARVAEALLGR